MSDDRNLSKKKKSYLPACTDSQYNSNVCPAVLKAISKVIKTL